MSLISSNPCREKERDLGSLDAVSQDRVPPLGQQLERARPEPAIQGLHIKQSKPDSSRGLKAEVLETFEVVPSSLGSAQRMHGSSSSAHARNLQSRGHSNIMPTTP